jgi:hypothetical protein
MKRKGFNEFIDKKARDGRRHLNIIRQVLHHGGLRVSDFTEQNDDDPYIFIKNPETKSTFHGVRIYVIGDSIAFRVQREEKTHPYGMAYSIKIPEMFADLVEDMKEEEAGKKVMENICKELKKFFVLSAKAEEDLQSFEIQGGDPLNRLVVQSTGVDVARQVGNST